MVSLFSAPRKLAVQLGLAWREPEVFARNLRQFTSPVRFLDDLLDHPDLTPLVLDQTVAGAPALNILLPEIARLGATGGPNTALAIARLASDAGMRVRLVACDRAPPDDLDWLRPHLATVTGLPESTRAIEVADASQRLVCGPRDLFLATFWTTASRIGAALGASAATRLLYLIQDYEPGFYAWSSRHALALATYDLPFRALINQRFVADYLLQTRTGRFADPGFEARCTIFEPALPRALFAGARAGAPSPRPRRLLLYLRPTNPRNLAGMAVAALRRVASDPAFRDWEFLGIGGRGSMPDVTLADGRRLRQARWGSYAEHAALLGASDILLAPMLSPHTGYPVLDMAATGGLAITSSFATKTPEALRAISPNIIGVAPTAEGFARALLDAARPPAAGSDRAAVPLNLPQTWSDALAPVLATIEAAFAA